MIIYTVNAVHIFSDYPHHSDIVSYHTTKSGAEKALSKIKAVFESDNIYDEFGNPLYEWDTSKAVILTVNVEED